MDPTSLSSNWKKLQATLKTGSTSTTPGTKRKASDRDSAHGTAKKPKSTDKQQTKTRPYKAPFKQKKMSQSGSTATSTTNANVDATIRKKSSSEVVAQTQLGSDNKKENEGRSPT